MRVSTAKPAATRMEWALADTTPVFMRVPEGPSVSCKRGPSVVAHPSFLVDPMGLRAAHRTQGRDSRASRAGMIVVIVRAQKSPLSGAGWSGAGFALYHFAGGGFCDDITAVNQPGHDFLVENRVSKICVKVCEPL
jgi:hypothetical protein